MDGVCNKFGFDVARFTTIIIMHDLKGTALFSLFTHLGNRYPSPFY